MTCLTVADRTAAVARLNTQRGACCAIQLNPSTTYLTAHDGFDPCPIRSRWDTRVAEYVHHSTRLGHSHINLRGHSSLWCRTARHDKTNQVVSSDAIAWWWKPASYPSNTLGESFGLYEGKVD